MRWTWGIEKQAGWVFKEENERARREYFHKFADNKIKFAWVKSKVHPIEKIEQPKQVKIKIW